VMSKLDEYGDAGQVDLFVGNDKGRPSDPWSCG